MCEPQQTAREQTSWTLLSIHRGLHAARSNGKILILLKYLV